MFVYLHMHIYVYIWVVKLVFSQLIVLYTVKYNNAEMTLGCLIFVPKLCPSSPPPVTTAWRFKSLVGAKLVCFVYLQSKCEFMS